MSFDVAAEAYDAFMGRWSRLLSSQLADFADVRARQRVLDVGCGTGALTSEGLHEIESTALTVELSEPTFESWWTPFERGFGPAGAFVASLDSVQQEALRNECRRRLSDGPIVMSGAAWAARGRP